jgi:hypothetical protein
MNIFTRHFIHLYFLAEFEVLFYIYYIMPYEKKLIYNIFKIQKMSDYVPIQNITQYMGDRCDGYTHEFDSYNDKLIMKCFYIICFLNVVLGGVMIHDIVKIYRKYSETPKRRTYNSTSSLVSFGSSTNIAEMKKSDELVDEHRDETFVIYYCKNSEFILEIIKTIQFIILVGIFEYVFFTTIVNKYKIVNSKTLICKMIDELH